MISKTDQPPFLSVALVPVAGGHGLEDLTFAGLTKSVKVVIQFATSDFPVGGQQCSVDRRFKIHTPFGHTPPVWAQRHDDGIFGGSGGQPRVGMFLLLRPRWSLV